MGSAEQGERGDAAVDLVAHLAITERPHHQKRAWNSSACMFLGSPSMGGGGAASPSRRLAQRRGVRITRRAGRGGCRRGRGEIEVEAAAAVGVAISFEAGGLGQRFASGGGDGGGDHEVLGEVAALAQVGLAGGGAASAPAWGSARRCSCPTGAARWRTARRGRPGCVRQGVRRCRRRAAAGRARRRGRAAGTHERDVGGDVNSRCQATARRWRSAGPMARARAESRSSAARSVGDGDVAGGYRDLRDALAQQATPGARSV